MSAMFLALPRCQSATFKTFCQGRTRGFDDWWRGRSYAPVSQSLAYLNGYAIGWEAAADPLHETGLGR